MGPELPGGGCVVTNTRGQPGLGIPCAESLPRGGSKETSALLAAPSRSLSAQEGPAVQLALMRTG